MVPFPQGLDPFQEPKLNTFSDLSMSMFLSPLEHRGEIDSACYNETHPPIWTIASLRS